MKNIQYIIGNIADCINNILSFDDVADIRIRVNSNVVVRTLTGGRVWIDRYITEDDIKDIVSRATAQSAYAYEDELGRGYLYVDGGIRIGVCGDYKLIGPKPHIKRFSSLIIRIARDVVGAADKLDALVIGYKNTLIVSPPGCGKTTLLRDFVRKLSNQYDVLILDERYEISGGINTEARFSIDADFLCGVDKRQVAIGGLRSVSPEIVAMDEIGIEDMALINDLASSGVKVLATMHADSLENVKNRLGDTANIFDNIVILNSTPRIGNIQSIVRKA